MELSKLFSNSGKTRVLEVLSRHREPLHLRRIAELSGLQVHAADVILRALRKKKTVSAKRKGKYLFFQLRDLETIKVLEEIIEIIDRQDLLAHEDEWSRRLARIFEFTDEITKMYSKKTQRVSSKEFVVKVLSYLKESKLNFVVAGEMAASIYRKELKLVNEVKILLDIGEQELDKLSLAISKTLKLSIESLSKERISFKAKGEDMPPLKVVLESASERKQQLFDRSLVNLLEFNGDHYSVLRPEDSILELSLDYQENKDELLKVDDIQNIFASRLKLDLSYLLSKLRLFALPFHVAALEEAPEIVAKASREAARQLNYATSQ